MFEAILQGILQGITEFLPISSSGHLIFLQYVLGQEANKDFITGLHLATCIAVLIYFHKRILKLIRNGLFNKNINDKEVKKDKQLLKTIITGSIMTIFIGIIIKITKVEDIFNNLFSVGIASIIFSILLFLTVTRLKTKKQLISTKDALLIGSSQMIAALLPGGSRFGITLTVALLLGLKNKLALEYVFFLSIPAIFFSSINEIIFDNNITLNLEFVVSFISAFISGLFSIFLVQQIKRRKIISMITIYRILFGILCIFLHFTL